MLPVSVFVFSSVPSFLVSVLLVPGLRALGHYVLFLISCIQVLAANKSAALRDLSVLSPAFPTSCLLHSVTLLLNIYMINITLLC